MNDNLVGHNTDINGFKKAIQNLNFNIKNKKIFILGAGGVVPSIIFSLIRMNVSEIIISNRTRQKADDLKSHFKNLNVIDWGSIPNFDVIINATSLGLKNEVINLNFSQVGEKKLFFDENYNPSLTSFLKEGKKFGNLCENGKLMFIYKQIHLNYGWYRTKNNIETIKLLENGGGILGEIGSGKSYVAFWIWIFNAIWRFKIYRKNRNV